MTGENWISIGECTTLQLLISKIKLKKKNLADRKNSAPSFAEKK